MSRLAKKILECRSCGLYIGSLVWDASHAKSWATFHGGAAHNPPETIRSPKVNSLNLNYPEPLEAPKNRTPQFWTLVPLRCRL